LYTLAPPSEEMAPERRTLLVVGDGPGLASLTRDSLSGARPIGVLAGDRAAVPTGWAYLGPIDQLPHVLRTQSVAEVALCLDASERSQMGDVAALCMKAGIPTWLPLAVAAEPQAERHPAARTAKRVLDVVGALTGMIVLSPVLLTVAIAIAATDGFPVMFRQPRAGLGGRPFSIMKFRTMGRDADGLRSALRGSNEVSGGASFKLQSDPRVTRLGAVLRKTSIDELPQLWNVLLGEMSLVGPRPHPYDDVAGYQPWQFRRLSVKPGLTGLWQVELRDDPDFDNWVRKDLEYIDGWSIWRDIALIFRTIPAVIRGTGR